MVQLTKYIACNICGLLCANDEEILEWQLRHEEGAQQDLSQSQPIVTSDNDESDSEAQVSLAKRGK